MQPVDLPGVDDRVVEPETGTEMIRGEVRKVLPAEPPHADRQSDVTYVLRSNVAPGYVASTELLTRVDHDSDFATDVCIRRDGEVPGTESRYLEELSFEIKHKQSEADILSRVRMLAQRGVRRIFVIAVKQKAGGRVEAGPVREWLAREDRWLEWHPSAEIADPCLVTPIKVQALLDAAEADRQVIRALAARKSPALIELVETETQKRTEAQVRELNEAHTREMQTQAREHTREMQAQARAHTREMQAQARALADVHTREMQAQARALADAHAREAILELCAVLGIEVTAERQARLVAMSGDELAALRSVIRTGSHWPRDS